MGICPHHHPRKTFWIDIRWRLSVYPAAPWIIGPCPGVERSLCKNPYPPFGSGWWSPNATGFLHLGRQLSSSLITIADGQGLQGPILSSRIMRNTVRDVSRSKQVREKIAQMMIEALNSPSRFRSRLPSENGGIFADGVFPIYLDKVLKALQKLRIKPIRSSL
jgi:hypothetical protein